MSIRSLPRGVDLERDKRLDALYSVVFLDGPHLRRSGNEYRMECHVTEYGYDGTVIRDEVVVHPVRRAA